MSFLLRHLTAARLFTFASALAVLWGWQAPLANFLTPERGIGYALGIIGGSMMLLIVIYPARKRVAALSLLGSNPFWFRAHMVLGVIGPILILYHANFSLGATNSNVALWCTLLVAGSGIIGRYFYSRVYDQLLGRQGTVEETRAVAEQLRSQGTTVAVLPHLIEVIEREEKWALEPAHGPIGRAFHPLLIGVRATLARRHLRRYIRTAIRDAGKESRPIRWQSERLAKAAFQYASRRLDAQRKVAEYRMYARLTSLWHVLHVPLFIFLIIAAIVHIVAVHTY